MTRYLLCVLILVALAALGAPPALAAAADNGNPNPTVLPLTASVGGLTYSQWADRWWQWAWAIPANQSPINDLTGELAAVGQSGNVFFLAQVGVGVSPYHGIADRTITVPAGTFLFAPMFDVGRFQMPIPDCACPTDHDEALAYLGSCLTGCLDNITVTAEVIVDGRPLTDLLRYRVISADFFTATIDADIPWAVNFGVAWPTGTTDHNLQAGYYVMLTPLAVGEHTVYINTCADFGPYGLWGWDATYHITIQ